MLTLDLVEWVIRTSLLLAIGLLIARSMEYRSAAMAHRILVAAIAGVLILPIAATMLPAWHLQTPDWVSVVGTIPDSTAATKLRQSTSPSATTATTVPQVSMSKVSVLEPSVEQATERFVDSDFANTKSPQPDAATLAFPAAPPISRQAQSTVLSTPQATPWSWRERLAAVWIVVAGALLGRAFLFVARLHRFVRGCAAADTMTTERVALEAQRLGVKRRVRVLHSRDDAMPMACWLRRWTMVLPTNFSKWPDDVQHATLVHELGHIARRDAWADFFAHSVTCILWPNPLSWLAVHNIRRLRERACDEWALQKSPFDAKAYASCLLSVVERCQAQRLHFASTMASRPDFESRIKWLLSTSRPTVARPFLTTAIMLCMAGIGLTIVTAQPIASQVSQPHPEQAAAAATDISEADAPRMIISKDPSPAAPAISVQGIVVDENGSPLSGMHVVLRGDVRNTHQYCNGLRHYRDILARTESDSTGRFSFTSIAIPPRMTDVIRNLRGGSEGAQLVVWGDGRAVTFAPIKSFDGGEKQIALLPEADVSGVIVDEDGKAVDRAVVTCIGFTKGTSDLSAFLDDPGDRNLYQSEIAFRATTQDGRFSLHHMPRDMRLSIRCEGKSGERAFFLVNTGAGDFRTTTYRNGGGREADVFRTPIKATAKQQPWVKIRILDHEGNPVRGGGVEAVDDQRHYGGAARVGDDGTAVLIVNNPGVHKVGYHADPLEPAVGLQVRLDINNTPPSVVELRLPEPKLLEGKVVHAESGSPVIGAYVQFYNTESWDQDEPVALSAMAVSNTNGIFRLPIVAGEWKLALRHELDGYVTSKRVNRTRTTAGTTVTVTDTDVPDNVIIKVARGLEIRGRVKNKDGTAIAGAKILAENEDRPYTKATAVTNDRGFFVLSGLSPAVATRVSTWTDQGTTEQMIEAVEDAPLDKTVKRNIVLTVAPGTTLTGRVVQDGKPVAGIKVKLMNAPPQPPEQDWTRFRLIHEAITDAEGRYRVTGLHKGDQYHLEIEVTGTAQVRDWRYQSPYSHTMGADDGDTIELPDARLVSNAQELRGIVVDPDGNPVPGITVSARLASGGRLSRPQKGPPPWTQTDKEGRFKITNLPDEQISLMAYRSNPAGGRIYYPSSQTVDLNDLNIRMILDPKLGTGIEDLDAP